MKKIVLGAVSLVFFGSTMAQGPVVIDTVITGVGYGTNVWYSLANDEQATSPSDNWDIAIGASAAQGNPLASAVLFNSKVGKLYVVPNLNPATSFDTLSTLNFDALTPLVNNDSSWADGALNVPSLGGFFDYGWGMYNQTSHNVDPYRIFVIKYNDNSVKKFHLTMLSIQGKYSIVSADLANGAPQTTKEIVLSNYSTKNFAYYKIDTNTELDREPAKTDWDFEFLQYDASLSPGMQYFSFGILTNLGVEAVKVGGVADVENFDDYASQSFSTYTNAIGYDWKNAQAQTVPDDVVYFVKDKSSDIWKLVFTEFTTGSGGNSNRNVFSKQNLTTLGLGENNHHLFVSVYPNPAKSNATVVVDATSNTQIKVVDLKGQVVFEKVVADGLQAVSINTSDLNSGMYLVQISNGTAAKVERLVVQH